MFKFILLVGVLLSSLSLGGPEEAIFMKAIRADIYNKQLRLGFGRWLEQNGQPERGKFLQLLNSPEYEADPDRYEDRLDRMLERHFRKLFPNLPGRFYTEEWYKSPLNFYMFDGIGVITANIDAQLLGELDKILADDSPVIGLELKLEGWDNPVFTKLLERPALRNLSYLQLNSVYFNEVEEFVECRNLSNLRRLTFNEPEGIFAPAKSYILAKGLATSKVFSNLTTLRVPLWPMEQEKKKELVRDEIIPLYLESKVLGRVTNSPLVYPGAVATFINHNRRESSPYIDPDVWDARKTAATCSLQILREKSQTDIIVINP